MSRNAFAHRHRSLPVFVLCIVLTTASVEIPRVSAPQRYEIRTSLR